MGKELPVWARQEALPKAIDGYGWVDFKNRFHPVTGREQLIEKLYEDVPGQVSLVWSPESDFLQVPEELPWLEAAASTSRDKNDRADWEQKKKRLWLGSFALSAVVLWLIFSILDFPTKRLFSQLFQNLTFIVSLLVYLVAFLFPYFGARSRMQHEPDDIIARVSAFRFELWLGSQKLFVTRFLLGLIVAVYLVQLMGEGGIARSVDKAGLVKEAYRASDFWRAFTAALMHGGWVHIVMNGLGLLYLGRRIEVLAGWPHLVFVFVFSALAGAEASNWFSDRPTVGASGALMGWLGFLLVFETLHSKLIPRNARKQLLTALLMTVFIGAIGYRFIDNANHLGGLFAGGLYALLVFPKSSSVFRPGIRWKDRIVGAVCLVFLTTVAVFAIWKILS